MKVIDAQSRMLRQLIETGRLLRVLDEAANIRNLRGILRHQRCRIRFAAFARTETGSFGILTRLVESYVLRSRQTSGAAGTTIHTCSRNRIIEFAVRRRIARDHGRPATIVLRCGRELRVVSWFVHTYPQYELNSDSYTRHSADCFQIRSVTCSCGSPALAQTSGSWRHENCWLRRSRHRTPPGPPRPNPSHRTASPRTGSQVESIGMGDDDALHPPIAQVA